MMRTISISQIKQNMIKVYQGYKNVLLKDSKEYKLDHFNTFDKYDP